MADPNIALIYTLNVEQNVYVDYHPFEMQQILIHNYLNSLAFNDNFYKYLMILFINYTFF